MITIVDNGGANIASIMFALQRLGVTAQLSSDANSIRQSSHVILPGVGAAAPAMQRLHAKSLVNVIRQLTQPVLGICLGMQLLFDYSEEGNVDCLQLIPGKIIKLSNADLVVPHMGWNQLSIITNDLLLNDVETDSYAYYVHSYAAPLGKYTIAKTYYGCQFSAIVKRDNFYGIQFHPEKSSSIGAKILKNFLEL